MRESKKAQNLYLFFGIFFVANAIIAEFIGIKVFSFERTFGGEPVNWHILGYDLSFNLTVGVLLWPLIFVMTDLINEYYGTRGVRRLSYIAAGIITYAFLIVYMAINTTGADFWNNIAIDGGSKMPAAYTSIFGQGQSIILGSLVAFILGQLLDVFIFHRIKKMTGEKYLWLRANVSTFISQLIDTFAVLYIAFYLTGIMPLNMVIAVGIMNMIFKICAALVLTPVLYLVHHAIENYLGKDVAAKMKEEAAR